MVDYFLSCFLNILNEFIFNKIVDAWQFIIKAGYFVK